MDPDPDPRIHLSVIVDPDPWIHILKKWIIGIRIRVPIFNILHIFHKEIHVGQIKMLISYYRQNLEKAFLRYKNI